MTLHQPWTAASVLTFTREGYYCYLCFHSPPLCGRHPWNKVAHLYQFWWELQEEVKYKLAQVELYSGFNAFVDPGVCINHQLQEWREEKRYFKSPSGLYPAVVTLEQMKFDGEAQPVYAEWMKVTLLAWPMFVLWGPRTQTCQMPWNIPSLVSGASLGSSPTPFTYSAMEVCSKPDPWNCQLLLTRPQVRSTHFYF